MAARVAPTIGSVSTTSSLTGDRLLSSKLHGTDINKMYIPLFGGIDPINPGMASQVDHRGEFFISQLRKIATLNKKEGESYTAVREYRYKTTKTEKDYLTSVRDRLDIGNEDVWASRQTISPRQTSKMMPTLTHYNKDEGNTQFKNILPWMYDKNELYSEMLIFICEFTERIGNKNLDDKVLPGVLNFIRSIPNFDDKGERNFAIAVVQTFVKDLSYNSSSTYIDNLTGQPIEYIMNPDKWDNISAGLFFSKRTIIHNLFGNKFTRSTDPTSHTKTDYNDETVMGKYRQAILKAQCNPDERSIRFFTPNAMGRYLMKQVESAINRVKEEDIKHESSHAQTHAHTLASPNISSPLLDNLATTYDKSKKFVKKYRYIRRDKELYIVTEDGKETLANDFSKDICQAVGMNTTSNYKINCDNFIIDCIGGKNIGACAYFLFNEIFWIKELHDYLDNINLYLAHVALEQYKIPKDMRDGLVIYKNVTEWHKLLNDYGTNGNEGLNDQTAKAIIQNEPLNAVIQGIINQINATPAILNPSVVGEVIKEEAKSSSPVIAYLRGTNNPHSSWSKGRIAPGEIPAVVDTKMKELTGHYDEIYKIFKPMLRNIVGSPNILRHPYMHNFFPRLGGGAGEIENYNVQSTDFYSYYKRLENLIKMVETGVMPSWLHDTVRNYENLLKENGINIAEGDLKHLHEVIDGIKKLEKQVLFAIKGAASFALLLNSDIGPVVKDLPSDSQEEHLDLKRLYALKNKTIDQMFKMLEIATKKLEKYCSKTNKLGGLCGDLAKIAP
jgi:hypothetical protein